MTHNRIKFQEAPEGLYKVMLQTEQYIKECGIPHSLIELIKTRASQINKCGYCLDMHHKDALHAGESFDRLYLLPAWEESPVFSDAEKAALNLTDVLTTISDVSPEMIDHAYERAAKHFSKQEVANLVLAICQINSWNRIAITCGNVPGSYKVRELTNVS